MKMKFGATWFDDLINTPEMRRADFAEGIALAVSETIHAEANRVRAVREACERKVRDALVDHYFSLTGDYKPCPCGRPCECF